MAERITIESDPGRFEALKRQWEAERKPGFLVTSNTTYRVLQLVDGKLAFEPIKAESMYESTGV